MHFPSNKTLARIAVYGAVAGLSAIMLMRQSMQDRIRKADYYKLALQELRRHKGGGGGYPTNNDFFLSILVYYIIDQLYLGAVDLLGEPIKEMGFDFTKQSNFCDGKTAHFEVSVKGSMNRGKILFWAIRDIESGWLIDRLELEVKSQPDKRFLIKKPTFQGEEITAENMSNA